MSTQNSLDKYTRAVEAIKDHQGANKAVFDEHQRLLYNLMDAENELRDAVAESGEGISNGSHKVTVVPQTQRIYSEDKLHQYLNSEQFADVVNDVTRPPRITIGEVK
jgi:uncharacterized protein YdcH (DUF465 family)